MAATLVDELIEEILMRISPEEPAHLVFAAVVCKAWRRILSDDGFLRRYRRFHGTPPLLDGYIQNHHYYKRACFIPTKSTRSPVSTDVLEALDHIKNCVPLDCRHGRVLIHTCTKITEGEPPEKKELIVWDPITGGMQHLSVPPYQHEQFTGSVLCATNGCDHLDCSGGPFAVVFVWIRRDDDVTKSTWASIYSSEAGAWSAPTYIDIDCHVHMRRSLLLGDDALYFSSINIYRSLLLKYDLFKHTLSIIDTPPEIWTPVVLKGEDDRGLQLATLSDNCIYMWSQQGVTNGMCDWVKNKVMDVPPLLIPECGSYTHARKVIGFAEGTDIIFLSTDEGIFTLSIKSSQVKMVSKTQTIRMYPRLPYTSFYAPR